MELREIKEIVAEIIFDIEKNTHQYTYRKYDTFLASIGMSKRKNLKILNKFQYQFKKNNLTLWCGEESVKHINYFVRGEFVTFRVAEESEIIERKPKSKSIKYDYAGTINVAQTESRIKPYKHQEKAFYNLTQKITKTNKNPFAGLLVLPTGGGKTLTAGYWLCKNYLDKGKKVLWIAHRHELLEQAKNTFSEKLTYHDIFENRDSFNYRIISGIHDKPINIRKTDDLIISSKDSLNAGFDHLDST